MKKTIIISFILTVLVVCPSKKVYAQKEGYKLVWHDEFEGTKLDTTKWEHRALGARRGGTVVKEATKVNGKGNLIITTTILDSNNYYVGMIGTGNTYNTTYGYFEARVKFGKRLSWDSFWLQSPTAYKAGPTSETGAEIDICEYYGSALRTVSGWDDSSNAIWDTLGYKVNHNVHWADDNGVMNSWGGRSSLIQDPNEYVILAVEWTADRYYFYVNDSLTYDTRKGVSGVDEYIILSVEPYYWNDLPDSIQNGATVQDTFFVDYVRVYKKNPTGILSNGIAIQKNYELKQNYPNPFNPTTTIEYTIPKITHSTRGGALTILKIYDVLGKEVATLVEKEQKSGNYQVVWNGRNNNGKKVSSGIYYYQLRIGNFSQTKKMLIAK